MAHELISGVYGNATAPWHFAETGADGRSKVREGLMTTEVALTESGVGTFETRPVPLYTERDGAFVKVPDWQAIEAAEDGAVLGVHTGDYQHSSYRDSFEALGFAPDQAVWETMVLLRERKVAAGVLRLPDLDIILPDDSHLAAYIAAWTSHNADFALTYADTNVRIECMNRLRQAETEQGQRRIRVLHRAGLEAARAEAGRIITYAQERIDYQAKDCERLLAIKLDAKRVDAIIAALYPLPEKAAGDVVTLPDGSTETVTSAGIKAAITRATNKRAGLAQVVDESADLENCRGTAWAFIQELGAWTDHGTEYHDGPTATGQERRFVRTVLDRETTIDKAFALISELEPVNVPVPVLAKRSHHAAAPVA